MVERVRRYGRIEKRWVVVFRQAIVIQTARPLAFDDRKSLSDGEPFVVGFDGMALVTQSTRILGPYVRGEFLCMLEAVRSAG